jgi:hypothetical protein
MISGCVPLKEQKYLLKTRILALIFFGSSGTFKTRGLKAKAKSWQSIKLTWEKQEGQSDILFTDGAKKE